MRRQQHGTGWQSLPPGEFQDVTGQRLVECAVGLMRRPVGITDGFGRQFSVSGVREERLPEQSLGVAGDRCSFRGYELAVCELKRLLFHLVASQDIAVIAD